MLRGCRQTSSFVSCLFCCFASRLSTFCHPSSVCALGSKTRCRLFGSASAPKWEARIPESASYASGPSARPESDIKPKKQRKEPRLTESNESMTRENGQCTQRPNKDYLIRYQIER